MPLALAALRQKPAGPVLRRADAGAGRRRQHRLAGGPRQPRGAGQLSGISAAVRAVVLDEAECPPPTGWAPGQDTHVVFGLAPGKQLPNLPWRKRSGPLWQSLDPEPRTGRPRLAADLLFPDRPSRGGTTFTLSSAPSAAGAGPVVWTLEQGGEHRLHGGSLRAWQTDRLTWPAARLRSHCGGAASVGGLSSGWPTPSRRRACSPCPLLPGTGALLYPPRL